MPEQTQPQRNQALKQVTSTVVFWWLAAMGMLTLALTATIPAWAEYKQVAGVRDQMRQQIADLRARAEKNDYYIRSYREDPEALELLAISDLQYRRPDEAPLPVAREVFASFTPAGSVTPAAAAVARDAGDSAGEQSVGHATAVEQYVRQAHMMTERYIGPARTIGLARMFCDKTSRNVLTVAALAVLATALYLCRPVGESRN